MRMIDPLIMMRMKIPRKNPAIRRKLLKFVLESGTVEIVRKVSVHTRMMMTTLIVRRIEGTQVEEEARESVRLKQQ